LLIKIFRFSEIVKAGLESPQFKVPSPPARTETTSTNHPPGERARVRGK